jgi:hypothetical protein
LASAFIEIKKEIIGTDISLAIPHGFGCGLAGGDWDAVYAIIRCVFEEIPELIVIYKFEG